MISTFNKAITKQLARYLESIPRSHESYLTYSIAEKNSKMEIMETKLSSEVQQSQWKGQDNGSRSNIDKRVI